jgi:hypothetical protein
LAGIAIVWIFKSDVLGVPTLPAPLLKPLGLIILGLTFDFLQYAVATVIWGAFNRHKERGKLGEEAEFVAPRQFNWPALAFFWLKVVAITAAYCLLLHFLVYNIVAR